MLTLFTRDVISLRWIFISTYLMLLSGVEYSCAADRRYAQKLVYDLYLDYKKDIRPVNDTNNVLSVNFTVFLHQIIELDERAQTFSCFLSIRQEWRDAGLTWIPRKYDGIDNIRIPAKKIWLPDIVLYNSAEATFTRNLDDIVIVKSNGQVRWEQPVTTRAMCRMDGSEFPFDSQNCRLQFGSRDYDSKLLDLLSNQTELNRDNFITNQEWTVTMLTLKRTIGRSAMRDEAKALIEINFQLKRKSSFYIYLFIIPCVLISVLMPLTLLLPNDSGGKVPASVTTMLVLVVLLVTSVRTAPPFESAPLFVKYYITTMLLFLTSTVFSICVQNIHYCGSNPPTLPRWVRKYILHHLAKILNVRVQPATKSDSHTGMQLRHFETSQPADDNKLYSIQEEESTPFLGNSTSHQQGVCTQGQKADSHKLTSNGSCAGYQDCQRDARYDLKSGSFTVNSSQHCIPLSPNTHRTCPRNFTGFDRSGSGLPTVVYPVDTDAKYSTGNSISSSIPVLRKGVSQQITRANTRSSTPVSVTQQARDNLENKRKSLLVMNAITRTADYSDDTEVSYSTHTCSENSKCNAGETIESGCPSAKITMSEYVDGSTFLFGRAKLCSKSPAEGRCSSRSQIISSPEGQQFAQSPHVPPKDNSTQTSPISNWPEIANAYAINIAWNVDTIADYFRRNTTVAAIAEDWRSVAKVVDRLLLWIFLALQISFTALILLKIF